MVMPIRKNELETLEALGRGQADAHNADESVLERLHQLGYAQQRAGHWVITQRGSMELQRRKNLERKSGSR
jgi:hypothetical protein